MLVVTINQGNSNCFIRKNTVLVKPPPYRYAESRKELGRRVRIDLIRITDKTRLITGTVVQLEKLK